MGFISDLLPAWQSHKIVKAAKILQVFADDTMELDVNDPRISKRLVVAPADKMFARYRPVPGDYYVLYDDGYASISPSVAFESGYHRYGSTTSVRALLRVDSRTEHFWGGKTIKFSASYDPEIEEHRRFTKATPSGSAELTIDNPPAEAFFENGKHYYVDFSKALGRPGQP